jgi:hypothetical protein
MKKSMLGCFGLARYQTGPDWDGSDEKTRVCMLPGVSGLDWHVHDCSAYDGSMSYLLRWLGLAFWL